MKVSLASVDVLAFVIAQRGYVVFRFSRRYAFRIGGKIERFTNGTPLPQPFSILERTDRRDWAEQCVVIEKQFGRVLDVAERQRFTFFRCNTD